uniref:HSac2 domain-containing protein n=1 Tax=Macrostomum lignano TaxID=282301 RepID=A0A1I8JNU0_9PLAT
TQLRKLGLLYPEDSLPQELQTAFPVPVGQQRRPHEPAVRRHRRFEGRRLASGPLHGLMHDGMNSASRYYLRFNEFTRQTAIDCSLGLSTCRDLAEEIKTLADQTVLQSDQEKAIGCWPLILTDEAKSDESEMNCVLYLSSAAAYVIRLADKDAVQRVELSDINEVLLGPESHLLKARPHPCMRVVYKEKFHFTFRAPRKRLFNNMMISVSTEEEARDSLKAISESFQIAPPRLPSALCR